MSYLITREGRNGEVLFLVDRSLTKTQWWTENIDFAIVFRKYSAAKIQLKKLIYGNPDIIDLESAEKIKNDFIYE